MTWTGYPEEDPELLRERQEYEEREAYEERRRQDEEEQAYYEHYFSLDGWIDRMYDEFIKMYGDKK